MSARASRSSDVRGIGGEDLTADADPQDGAIAPRGAGELLDGQPLRFSMNRLTASDTASHKNPSANYSPPVSGLD